MKKLYQFALLVFIVSFADAQNSQLLPQAQNYLQQNAEKLGLNQDDLENLLVQTEYAEKNSEVKHLYVQQTHNGYPVYNAIGNFTFKNGEIVYLTHSFQNNLAQKIQNQQANQNLDQFAGLVAQNLGFSLNETATLNQDFHNELMYYPTENGKLNLSWVIHLNVKTENSTEILEVIANAQSGQIYDQHNHLLDCSFGHGSFSNPSSKELTENQIWLNNQFNSSTVLNDGAEYRVYKLPVEAPTFGEREMVISPADDVASPWGWHDTNGADGPEYTTTRGNNVIAMNDLDSQGYNWLFEGGPFDFNETIDGGSDLIFDFPIDFAKNLYGYKEASTTNLFYMNNMMHDIWYQYGFTEEAGNFQVNNYGNGGNNEDEVYAFGQTGERVGEMDNARFGTPPDGNNPYMIMFMCFNVVDF